MIGDCLVAAFFGAKKDKARKALRLAHRDRLEEWIALGDPALKEAIRDDMVGPLRDGEEGQPRLVPFHWELEFPEVFTGEAPGFDAMVGNPPFAGKNTIAAGQRDGYVYWLKAVHPKSHGNSDLVAHFYRRAYDLLRDGGCFGLIATNTIAQGDTRTTGLRWICTHDGSIYRTTRRYRWPGKAAVVVSVVHVHKGDWSGMRLLDGQEVKEITAFLFHAGGHMDPATLRANARKSFIGAYILGMGFTFDDTDKKGVASPVSEMKRLLDSDPRNSKRIFPYIGYSEVATHPRHQHHRWVINFGDMSEEEARQWPDLMALVEELVKPQRMKDNRVARKRYWWKYAEQAPALQRAMSSKSRVLVAGAQATAHFAFAFLPTGMVFSSNLTVLTVESYAAFASIQCRVHEVWSRFFMTTLEDRLVYTPTTCFENYPFLPDWQTSPTLEAAGQAYYDFRAALMVRNDEGLTTTYNRFHDPHERHADIKKLRELHAAMDRAVLDAYGWSDISSDCAYLLDYEEEDEEDDGRRRRKKKPWRYRWPDEIRDEVLARLLALNRERALQEKAAGKKAAKSTKRPKKAKPPRAQGTRKRRERKPAPGGTLTLFPDPEEPR